MVSFFRAVQDKPIPRDVVDAVARQEDFMRRIRSDDGHGTRDLLLAEDILLLSGTFKSRLIKELGLPKCARSEFISHKISNEKERELPAGQG